MRSELIAAVRESARTIVDPFDVDELLARLMQRTTTALGADGAGIMLPDEDGDLRFVAASGPRVRAIESLQGRMRTGACYEAFTTGEVVAAPDLRNDDRWPDYRERALEVGLEAVVGVPLQAAGQIIGVLNVYASEPRQWSAEDKDACETLSALGAAYLLVSQQARSQHALSQHLYAALESRGFIERAKGIIMARDNVDAHAAFEELRKVSMATNHKLRDVAKQVIQEHVGLRPTA